MDKNIYGFFKDFISQNKSIYFLYFILLLSFPLDKIYIPHLYGKIISKLKNKISFGIFTPLIITWFIVQIKYLFLYKIDTILSPKFYKYIRKTIIESFINQLEKNFKDVNHGEFISKLIKIPSALQEIFNQTKQLVFVNIILTIGIIIYFAKQNIKLGLLFFVLLTLFAIFGLLYKNDCKKEVYNKEIIHDKLHEEIQDMLSNILSIFSFGQKKNEISELHKKEQTYINSINSCSRCHIKWKLVFTILIISIFVIMNLFILKLYKNKKLKVDQVSSLFIIIYSQMHKLIHTYLNIGSFINANGEIESVLNYINILKDKSNIKNKLKFINGDIKFKNIYFKYNKNNDHYLFNNLNLTIKKNSKIALIGHIGSGKSTLIKLLMGYYPINKGDITIKNQSIYKTDITSLRTNISYVPQSLSLFNRTLYDNITYGSHNIKEADILKIFDKLNMVDIKKIFKRKMYINVGKNGNNLSGGQKQIVWLLRAFLSNNNIIIIDEPTASLDHINKKNVIKIIETLFLNKTVIIITHDTYFINRIDNVIQFDNGKIIKKTLGF